MPLTYMSVPTTVYVLLLSSTRFSFLVKDMKLRDALDTDLGGPMGGLFFVGLGKGVGNHLATVDGAQKDEQGAAGNGETQRAGGLVAILIWVYCQPNPRKRRGRIPV